MPNNKKKKRTIFLPWNCYLIWKRVEEEEEEKMLSRTHPYCFHTIVVCVLVTFNHTSSHMTQRKQQARATTISFVCTFYLFISIFFSKFFCCCKFYIAASFPNFGFHPFSIDLFPAYKGWSSSIQLICVMFVVHTFFAIKRDIFFFQRCYKYGG